MALFNGPGAALALFNLSAAEPFVECPAEQLYIVESVITKMVAFARATFTAGGWNPVSTAGYTMASLLERQLKHVLWIQSMGEMEQGTLFPHAQATFVAALQAAELYVQRFFLDPEPADIVLDHILPFGESYDNELKKKTAGAAPMVLVRRSFPGLLPPSTPRSLPGVTLTSPPREKVAPGGGGAIKGTPVKTAPTGGKDQIKKPGSMKTLPTWVDDTHMRLGALVYDVAAVGEYYSLDAATCWPVLLSSKKGGEALCLCANWGEDGHTSLTSAAHQRPKAFNVVYIEKTFTTKSTGPAPTGTREKTAGDKRKGGGKR